MINMEKRDWTSSREDAMRAGTSTATTLVILPSTFTSTLNSFCSKPPTPPIMMFVWYCD